MEPELYWRGFRVHVDDDRRMCQVFWSDLPGMLYARNIDEEIAFVTQVSLRWSRCEFLVRNDLYLLF